MVVNMYRYFISQYPTFGSYKKPKPYLVEASPYFWWWYALTLNETYAHLCELRESGSLLTESETDFPEAMHQVYEDFGDLRYEGCRYRAFAKWWRERVSTGETRGEYLFAEPNISQSVKALTDAKEAANLIEDSNCLVISIPLNQQRQHIDKAIDRLLKKHLEISKGWKVRDLSNSLSRYSLQRHVKVASLKKSMIVYEIRDAANKAGAGISNIQVANEAGLMYNKKPVYSSEVADVSNENRKVSTTISRYYSDAKKTINNAGRGVFP